jgi:recombinational DNA repair ATPase RecF
MNSSAESLKAVRKTADSFPTPKDFLQAVEALSRYAETVTKALEPALRSAQLMLTELEPAQKQLAKVSAHFAQFREALAHGIRAALRKTFKRFTPLEDSLRSLNKQPKLESFLGVAQRLFSRLTIHSQSSNSPPVLVA